MKSFVLVLALALFVVTPIFAQEPSPASTPYPAPSIAPGTDPATATRAWLDTVPPDKKAKSDAYFEGGYWLILWNFLLDAAIAILLLGTGLSARIRDFAERTTRFKAMQVALYAVSYVIITTVLSFPLIVYQRFYREHAYGLATQTFGPWFSEVLMMIVISTIATTILLIILYAVFRRARQTWWLWGTGVVILFLAFGIMIAPIYIEPLFNKYKPLADQKINESILTMARANQIPVTQVFEVDASRQSNRVSANVAGFLGTTRIALNDNLLKQCTLPEIRAVMAHEMGHYILNHIWKFLISYSLIVLISFAIVKWAFDAAVRRWGNQWRVRGIADPAGFPLLALIIAAISFLMTPVSNTVIRVSEIEADAFGMNTAREPEGFAKVALKLGTYRKLDPTPLEEFVFFDHPSGRARIRMAMDWKAAHLPAGGAE
ncbi:MAG: endopeptidase [Verrucomicrobiota bacterium]|jgi:STE24 endopeptidase